jgi:hypothetical protein
MARKSRARRLKAKQAPLASELKALRSLAHAHEHAALQQGSPRNSSGVKFSRVIGKATPMRPTSWEGRGSPKDFTKEPKRVTHIGTKSKDRAMIADLTAEFLNRGGKVS